jgi:hypothetical protein
MDEIIVCPLKGYLVIYGFLPARMASEINPLNHPPIDRVMLVEKGFMHRKVSRY